jgi:hypothetical protein
MSSAIPTISPLRQRFLDDMRMRKLASKTQSSDLRTVSRFYGRLKRFPDTATNEDLRRYQLYFVEHGMSSISLTATIAGLKFFFASTLDQPELTRYMHPVREPRKIPSVLSPEGVARLIGCAGSLKNQTALSVAYGAGLRVSEVVVLKVSDIDSQRMTLRIEQGKGRMDRYAMLSPFCWRACVPGGALRVLQIGCWPELCINLPRGFIAPVVFFRFSADSPPTPTGGAKRERVVDKGGRRRLVGQTCRIMEKPAWQVFCWLGKSLTDLCQQRLDRAGTGQVQQRSIFVLFDSHGNFEQ